MVFSLGDDAPVFKDGVKLWGPMIQRTWESPVQKHDDKDGKKDKADNNTSHKKSKGNQDSIKPAGAPSKSDTVNLGGRVIVTFNGNYLIVGVGEKSVQAIAARMKSGQTPKWWSAIAEQLPIGRRSVISYVNLRSVGDLIGSGLDSKQQGTFRTISEIVGLSNARSWIEVWGLDGSDFANKTLLTLDGEPRGLLQLLSDHPLRPEDLAPIPRDATVAAAIRLDPQKAMDFYLASLEKVDPPTGADLRQAIEDLKKKHGIDLRCGILRSLGETWCIYGAPSEGNFVFTGLTAVLPLRDWAGISPSYDRAMAAVKKACGESLGISLGHASSHGHDLYYLIGPQFSAAYVAPAWCLTKKEMVFALSPQNVKAYFSHDSRHEPLCRSPSVAKLFANGNAPLWMAYGDPGAGLRLMYPVFVPYAGADPSLAMLMQDTPFMSMLPSLPVIDRHLGPSTATLRRTKDGVELVTRGTIPMPTVSACLMLCLLSKAHDNSDSTPAQ